MGAESAFADLRRLAEWFATCPTRKSLHVEKIVERLGATCVPLLGRELTDATCARRDAARVALAQLATTPARARVIAELRRLADSNARDEGKVAALGLLAELGEHVAARFHDPSAIQRSSALALAAHLDEPADIAAAADMMIRTLYKRGRVDDDGIVSLLAVMADAVPAGAHRLASELCARLDVAPELRERIADVAPAAAPIERDHARRTPRPTLVTVLVDAAAPGEPARTVVVASRKHNGARRWRRWAVLIAATGAIEDCVHEDDAPVEADALVDGLVADGYRVTTTELEAAKTLVATAARHAPEQLPNAYYVGRDLLDLADAHLVGSHARRHASSVLGRAIELIADDDLPRARLLLARCDAATADVAAAHAAIAMAQGRHAEAAAQLARAVDAEPSWPLHHWNLACALHQLGDGASCYQALRRFLATSDAPSGLAADPDQPGRIAHATRLLAELERSARLTGTSLTRPRRKRRSIKAK